MGRTRKQTANWHVDGGAVVLGLVGLLFVGLSFRDGMEGCTLMRLSVSGTSTPARVTRTHSNLGRFRTQVFEYEFTNPTNGQRVVGTDKFHWDGPRDAVPTLDRLKLHSHSLEVRFLPSSPSVNRLDVAIRQRTQRRLIVFAFLLTSAGICGALAIWRCRR